LSLLGACTKFSFLLTDFIRTYLTDTPSPIFTANYTKSSSLRWNQIRVHVPSLSERSSACNKERCTSFCLRRTDYCL